MYSPTPFHYTPTICPRLKDLGYFFAETWSALSTLLSCSLPWPGRFMVHMPVPCSSLGLSRDAHSIPTKKAISEKDAYSRKKPPEKPPEKASYTEIRGRRGGYQMRSSLEVRLEEGKHCGYQKDIFALENPKNGVVVCVCLFLFFAMVESETRSKENR